MYPQEYQPQPKSSQRPFSPQYYAVPNLPAVAETISPPYLPFSQLMQRIPQRYPNAYLPPFHSKDSEPSQTTCQPMDAFHASKAESTRLADEFPFSYSIAKEMPHIFGNMVDDEVLDHPLTPSFECSSDLAPSREFVTHESCQFGFTTTDFSDCVLPEQSEISRNRPHSCCFGGNSVQSHPLIKEPSYGLMSEGRSLRFLQARLSELKGHNFSRGSRYFWLWGNILLWAAFCFGIASSDLLYRSFPFYLSSGHAKVPCNLLTYFVD